MVVPFDDHDVLSTGSKNPVILPVVVAWTLFHVEPFQFVAKPFLKTEICIFRRQSTVSSVLISAPSRDGDAEARHVPTAKTGEKMAIC
jgi:hypothetical protein